MQGDEFGDVVPPCIQQASQGVVLQNPKAALSLEAIGGAAKIVKPQVTSGARPGLNIPLTDSSDSQTRYKMALIQMKSCHTKEHVQAKKNLLKCLAVREQIYGPKCIESVEVYLKLAELLSIGDADYNGSTTFNKANEVIASDCDRLSSHSVNCVCVNDDEGSPLSRVKDDTTKQRLEERLDFLKSALEVVRENPRRIDATTRSALLFLRAQTYVSLAPHDGSGSFDLQFLHMSLGDLKRVFDLTVQRHQRSRRRGMQNGV
jgi:hypothetical protein